MRAGLNKSVRIFFKRTFYEGKERLIQMKDCYDLIDGIPKEIML